jgi:FtsZ-binding cell division protein ZapB
MSFVTELKEKILILQEALDSEKNLRKRLFEENRMLIEENREMADQLQVLRAHLEDIEKLR